MLLLLVSAILVVFGNLPEVKQSFVSLGELMILAELMILVLLITHFPAADR
jgi:hypothetical protein